MFCLASNCTYRFFQNFRKRTSHRFHPWIHLCFQQCFEKKLLKFDFTLDFFFFLQLFRFLLLPLFGVFQTVTCLRMCCFPLKKNHQRRWPGYPFLCVDGRARKCAQSLLCTTCPVALPSQLKTDVSKQLKKKLISTALLRCGSKLGSVN